MNTSYSRSKRLQTKSWSELCPRVGLARILSSEIWEAFLNFSNSLSIFQLFLLTSVVRTNSGRKLHSTNDLRDWTKITRRIHTNCVSTWRDRVSCTSRPGFYSLTLAPRRFVSFKFLFSKKYFRARTPIFFYVSKFTGISSVSYWYLFSKFSSRFMWTTILYHAFTVLASMTLPSNRPISVPFLSIPRWKTSLSYTSNTFFFSPKVLKRPRTVYVYTRIMCDDAPSSPSTSMPSSPSSTTSFLFKLSCYPLRQLSTVFHEERTLSFNN